MAFLFYRVIGNVFLLVVLHVDDKIRIYKFPHLFYVSFSRFAISGQTHTSEASIFLLEPCLTRRSFRSTHGTLGR